MSKREEILSAIQARIEANATTIKSVIRGFRPAAQISLDARPMVMMTEIPAVITPLARGPNDAQLKIGLITVGKAQDGEPRSYVNVLAEEVEKALLPDAKIATLSLGLDYVYDVM